MTEEKEEKPLIDTRSSRMIASIFGTMRATLKGILFNLILNKSLSSRYWMRFLIHRNSLHGIRPRILGLFQETGGNIPS